MKTVSLHLGRLESDAAAEGNECLSDDPSLTKVRACLATAAQGKKPWSQRPDSNPDAHDIAKVAIELLRMADASEGS